MDRAESIVIGVREGEITNVRSGGKTSVLANIVRNIKMQV